MGEQLAARWLPFFSSPVVNCTNVTHKPQSVQSQHVSRSPALEAAGLRRCFSSAGGLHSVTLRFHKEPNLEPGGCTPRASESFQQSETHRAAVTGHLTHTHCWHTCSFNST